MLAVGCTDPEAAKQRYLENGRRLAAEKRYAEAILEYRNALQIDDKFGVARLGLADALAASGNPEGAYREYQRAADLMPANADVQKKAATFLFMAGQFEDVRTRVEAVLKKNPEDIEAQLLYANALVGLRDLEGGVREIEEAVQLDPQHAASYTNLALLKMAQGQRQAAQDAFKKAVELDPKSIRARLALAHFELATGNLALAEESLKLALRLDPQGRARQPRACRRLHRDRSRRRWPRSLCRSSRRSPSRPAPSSRWPSTTARSTGSRKPSRCSSRCSRTPAPSPTRRHGWRSWPTASENAAGRAEMLDEVLALQPNHACALQVKARWLMVEGPPGAGARAGHDCCQRRATRRRRPVPSRHAAGDDRPARRRRSSRSTRCCA